MQDIVGKHFPCSHPSLAELARLGWKRPTLGGFGREEISGTTGMSVVCHSPPFWLTDIFIYSQCVFVPCP